MVGWKNSVNDPNISSVRLRCLEPLQVLRSRNYPVEIFEERHEKDYRVVVFNKIYDQPHLELACRMKNRGAKIVFDLCDNHLHNPNGDVELEERRERLCRMMTIADIVTVPCAELQRLLPVPARITRDGVRPLNRIEGWQRSISKRWRRHRCNLVWFGNWGGIRRAGGITDLFPLQNRLVEMAKRYDIGLTVISNRREFFEANFRDWKMPVYYEEWESDSHLRRSLARFDVCLLPVAQDPFTWCKSNNRLALALYLKLRVMAAAIPSYQEFAPYCGLGDWEGGLESVIENVISRRPSSGVARGKEFVEKNYLTAHAANDWQALFDHLLEDCPAKFVPRPQVVPRRNFAS